STNEHCDGKNRDKQNTLADRARCALSRTRGMIASVHWWLGRTTEFFSSAPERRIYRQKTALPAPFLVILRFLYVLVPTAAYRVNTLAKNYLQSGKTSLPSHEKNHFNHHLWPDRIHWNF